MPNHTDSTPSSSPIDRRTFVKAVSAAGVGLALGAGCATGQKPQTSAAAVAMQPRDGRRRYVIVGTGSRSVMYQTAIEKDYKQYAQLVGICDKNPGRMEVAQSRSKENGVTLPPMYAPEQFEKMIAEQQPDQVIVTTLCGKHHEYIIRSMNAGVDVISEKAMTTSAEKCQKILDARARTGKHCRVTFNYRYSPHRTQVKEMLMAGEIGDVLSVDFHWMLNTHHGADYFRRWHRKHENSGGLMVHKASHHFDLVNWWLGGAPVSVMATGKREFYTPAMAKRLGLTGPHERCHTCPEKDKCNFHFDLAADKNLKAMYLDQEKYDGYFRDTCVWSDQIDIEDTMNVLVKYDSGATLSYSLNAFNSWEGYNIAFNGTKGRIEHTHVEATYGGGERPHDGVKTTLIPIRGAARDITPWTGTGQHAGGDKVMLDELFLPSVPADKYLRADERAGAASCLVGIAANKCFQTRERVDIKSLVTGLRPPEWAPMPAHDQPVPMPPRVKPA